VTGDPARRARAGPRSERAGAREPATPAPPAGPGASRGLAVNCEGVLAGLPDAVIAVDGALRVVFWNAAAEELTKRSARRVAGRLLEEMFGGSASVVSRLAETLRTGESRSEADGVIEAADGRAVPVSIVTAPLFAHDGSVEAAVAVVRDVSRIRQLEDEVRRGETRAAAGRVAVGVAHEIRNPLGAIRGAIQLLERELGPQTPLREYTGVMLKEVDRVNRIIEDLLDLGRPVQLRRVPLNLHQLLERVVRLHEEAARAAGVTVLRRYDPSLPPIMGDEDRLLQVFHNLIVNALEAMKDGGRLTLATRASLNPLYGKMDLGAGPRATVEAVVADEGPGIPAAARARIFDPFFTTKPRGLGLGLALCHRVLEEHRGAIQVDSAEGRGTTVTCFLPIAR
jgi:two-component system nitrogen regulation sensor histidine kinase GlnL